MQVSSTNSAAVNSSLLDTTNTSAASRLPTQTLTQDDFLKLIVAQMSSQDPMKPVDDTQFVAQMAQFSTLQATTSMQQNIAQMSSQQSFLQANGLIGRNVSLLDSQGALINGTVGSVLMTSGTPQIVVNGQPYNLSTLLSVSEPATGTATTP
jgi:flagellar basal-body rod modification protein FlgD